LGASFRRAARKRGRKLFVWTVNEEGWMEWSVRKGVDGVITDEVERLTGVLDRFRLQSGGSGTGVGDGAAKVKRGGVGAVRTAEGIRWPRMMRLYATAIFWQALTLLVSVLLWHRLSNRGGWGKPKGMTVPGKR
jgi:phosphatidylglycerol phospholipase C